MPYVCISNKVTIFFNVWSTKDLLSGLALITSTAESPGRAGLMVPNNRLSLALLIELEFLCTGVFRLSICGPYLLFT